MNKAMYQQCMAEADRIVSAYKEEAVCEAYNWAATTTLIILAVMAVVAAGVSAYGQYEAGQTQKKIGDYNAKIASNNAINARQAADAQAKRIRDRGRALASTQMVGASKSGLQLSGSVSDVMYDSSTQNEMDAMMSLYKGQQGASDFQAQAALDKYQGNSAARLGTVGAGATLLSGASRAMSYYGQYQSMTDLKKAGAGGNFAVNDYPTLD